MKSKVDTFPFYFAFGRFCSLFYACFTFLFIVLLMLASQRIESFIIETGATMEDEPTKRGAPPTIIECLILAWVSGELAKHKNRAF